MSSPPAVVHVFETNRGIQSLAIRVSLVHQETNTRQMHRVCLFLRSQNQPSGTSLGEKIYAYILKVSRLIPIPYYRYVTVSSIGLRLL